MKNLFVVCLTALLLLVSLLFLKKDQQSQIAFNTATAFADTSKLQSGDLLFQDLQCGALCDAIELVTSGVLGSHLSHVGIIEKAANGRVYLIEAYGNVARTPIVTVLNRHIDKKGNPAVLIGRVREKYTYLLDSALIRAQLSIGLPYDDAFILKNGHYYCSELVYDSYKFPAIDSSLFVVAPMTFKDPKTGNFLPTWINYYHDLHLPIPEGEPGINPGLISRSDKLHILHFFGFHGQRLDSID